MEKFDREIKRLRSLIIKQFSIIITMEIETLLQRGALRFENTIIKSHTIKVIYFLGLEILNIRFLSILCLIPCELFRNIQLGQQIVKYLIGSITENQILTFLLVLLSSIFSISILYASIFLEKEIFSKFGFIMFLLLEKIVPVSNAIVLVLLFQPSINITVKIPAVLLFLVNESMSLILDKVFVTFSFDNENDFSHYNNNTTTYLKVVQKIIFYITFLLMTVLKCQVDLVKPYFFVLVVIQLRKLISYLSEKQFIDEIANFFEIFTTILSIAALTLTLAYEFYAVESLKINAYIFLLVISFFGGAAAYQYLKEKNGSLFLKTIQQVTQRKEFIDYLDACYNLWKNIQSTYYSLITASIRKNHQYECRKVKCYCHQASKIQTQKNSVSDGDKYFLKGYFQDIINQLEKQNKNNQRIMLKILYFKFRIFSNRISISREIKKINFPFFSNLEMSIGKAILQSKIKNLYMNYTTIKVDCLNIELPLLLSNLVESMQDIIFKDIHVRSKKWNSLCKDFCKALDIQEQIINQIAHLRLFDNIYEENKNTFRKSIAFNTLSLFYFGDIVFINKKLQNIETNLRELRTIVKYRQIINVKELSKNILDNRCCLLEFNLSKQQLIKIVDLTISNCTKNVLQIFKEEKGSFIQKKIQSIFPKFLWEMEKGFFQNILTKADEFQQFEACQKFFVDKLGHVFQGLVSLKMVSKENGITLMFLLFQKETKNIILLNNKGIIENIGETFINYFGKTYDELPFSSFFYFDDEYDSIKFTANFTKDRFIFLNGVELGEDWSSYLQRIKTLLRKKSLADGSGSKSEKQTDKSLNQNQKKIKQTTKTLQNEKLSYDQDIVELLRKQKRELIRSKIVTSRELTSYKQSRKTLNNGNISILSVSLDYKFSVSEDFIFYVIVIDEVKRKRSPSDSTQYTIKSIRQLRQGQKKYEGTLSKIEKGNEEKQLLEELENQDEAINSIDIEEELRKKKKQRELMLHEASSVQSSMTSSTVSFFYYKFIQICFNLFKNPDSIVDRRLNTFTVGSLIVGICFSTLVISTYVLFNLGLYEVKDIFFADGAVSDNMQLTEFMYNRAINFRQFKDNRDELTLIRQQAFYQRQYLYGLTVYDLGAFVSESTSMTNTKFYEYIKVPVVWDFNDEKSAPLEIETNQFLTYFYHLSREVEDNILDESKEGRLRVENALGMMHANFPEMKRINHENLFLYQEMSDDSMKLMRKLIIVLALSHVAISLIIFCIYYREKVFRRNQTIEGYSIYKLIPQKVIEFISNYYNAYSNELTSQKQLAKYEYYYDRQCLYLPSEQATLLKPTRNIFSAQKSFLASGIWKMVILVVILNATFAAMLLEIKALFDPIELMMKNVNSLMDSENYLIEAYIDIKSKFIIEQNYDSLEADFFDQLLQSQENTEVIFNKISVESLELFSNYDPDYKRQFIHLLVNDTCELIKEQVEPEQYQTCKSYFKLNYLNNGVITGMNFFTRRIKNLIYELKNKFYSTYEQMKGLSLKDRSYIQNLFNSSDFREIDQSLFFMFKMYQATQARIYESLEKTIISILKSSLLIVFFQVIIVGILYPVFLYYNFKREKFQLSQLYVSFLLIPAPLARFLKTFSAKIQHILEYEKNQ